MLNEFAKRKNAIDAIYTAIEDNIESADVSDIMRKIQNVVDNSIENMVEEPGYAEGKVIDISGLDFNLLEQYFTKTVNKNAAVQSLKAKIEAQLKQMIDRNPLTIDYYQRYQEIIEAYNLGKDETIIQEKYLP